jgi:predicted nucleotidyltransferase
MNTKRVNLFDTAHRACRNLKARYPRDASIDSILIQLEFLKELEEGKRKDAERLEEIIIDVLATREIAQLDESVADALGDVMEEVVKMKGEWRAAKFAKKASS